MRHTIVALACLFTVLITACTNAQTLVYDANAQVRKVDNFSGIEVSGAIVVYLSQGKEQAVAVSASDEKFVDKIKTEVRNGVLHIRPESGAWNGWNWGNKNIKAYVTVTELNLVNVSGASSVKATGDLNISKLRGEVSGAAVFKADLKGGSVSLEVTGASSVTLGGNVESFNIEASGASSVKAYDLTANYCDAQASGASGISVTVAKELSIEASGASSVGYKGTAVLKKVDSSGASSVKKRD